MKYHIDTIPVWDAYKENGECPLCTIRRANEQMYVDNFLGASVMEPDVRIEVNKKGFCGAHFKMLFDQQNRLGLALMTHTHFGQAMQSMAPGKRKKRGLLAAKETQETPLAALEKSCILCERLNDTMDRYLYTVLHLWKTDAEFAKRIAASKGHCLPHYGMLVQIAQAELSGKKADDFLTMLETNQQENMQRIEKELEWFTLKFDYRNADAPWGNSRDALERAINKLRGQTI